VRTFDRFVIALVLVYLNVLDNFSHVHDNAVVPEEVDTRENAKVDNLHRLDQDEQLEYELGAYLCL
jgi:hypothetical protein